jgi:hypothetical protein
MPHKIDLPAILEPGIVRGLLELPARATILRLAPKGVLICLGSDCFCPLFLGEKLRLEEELNDETYLATKPP